MAKKYLEQSAGRLKEAAGQATSSGAADGGKLVALAANGRLDPTLMPTGLTQATSTIVASEALAAGDIVNIHDNAGTPNVRKADASTAGKEAHGFVLDNVAAESGATVYLDGRNDALVSLTAGARYYLAATPGDIVSAAPAAAGNIVQYLGIAISASELVFEPANPITLA